MASYEDFKTKAKQIRDEIKQKHKENAENAKAIKRKDVDTLEKEAKGFLGFFEGMMTKLKKTAEKTDPVTIIDQIENTYEKMTDTLDVSKKILESAKKVGMEKEAAEIMNTIADKLIGNSTSLVKITAIEHLFKSAREHAVKTRVAKKYSIWEKMEGYVKNAGQAMVTFWETAKTGITVLKEKTVQLVSHVIEDVEEFVANLLTNTGILAPFVKMFLPEIKAMFQTASSFFKEGLVKTVGLFSKSWGEKLFKFFFRKDKHLEKIEEGNNLLSKIFKALDTMPVKLAENITGREIIKPTQYLEQSKEELKSGNIKAALANAVQSFKEFAKTPLTLASVLKSHVRETKGESPVLEKFAEIGGLAVGTAGLAASISKIKSALEENKKTKTLIEKAKGFFKKQESLPEKIGSKFSNIFSKITKTKDTAFIKNLKKFFSAQVSFMTNLPIHLSKSNIKFLKNLSKIMDKIVKDGSKKFNKLTVFFKDFFGIFKKEKEKPSPLVQKFSDVMSNFKEKTNTLFGLTIGSFSKHLRLFAIQMKREYLKLERKSLEKKQESFFKKLKNSLVLKIKSDDKDIKENFDKIRNLWEAIKDRAKSQIFEPLVNKIKSKILYLVNGLKEIGHNIREYAKYIGKRLGSAFIHAGKAIVKRAKSFGHAIYEVTTSMVANVSSKFGSALQKMTYQVVTFAGKFAARVVFASKTLFELFGSGITAFGSGLVSAVTSLGPAIVSVFTTVATVFSGLFASAIAFLASPVGIAILIGAGVTLLVGFIYKFRKTIAKVLKGIWSILKSIFKVLGKALLFMGKLVIKGFVWLGKTLVSSFIIGVKLITKFFVQDLPKLLAEVGDKFFKFVFSSLTKVMSFIFLKLPKIVGNLLLKFAKMIPGIILFIAKTITGLIVGSIYLLSKAVISWTIGLFKLVGSFIKYFSVFILNSFKILGLFVLNVVSGLVKLAFKSLMFVLSLVGKTVVGLVKLVFIKLPVFLVKSLVGLVKLTATISWKILELIGKTIVSLVKLVFVKLPIFLMKFLVGLVKLTAIISWKILELIGKTIVGLVKLVFIKLPVFLVKSLVGLVKLTAAISWKILELIGKTVVDLVKLVFIKLPVFLVKSLVGLVRLTATISWKILELIGKTIVGLVKFVFIKLPVFLVKSLVGLVKLTGSVIEKTLDFLTKIIANTIKFVFAKLPLFVVEKVINMITTLDKLIIKSVIFLSSLVAKLIVGFLKLVFVNIPVLLVKLLVGVVKFSFNLLKWIGKLVINVFINVFKGIFLGIPYILFKGITGLIGFLWKNLKNTITTLGEAIFYVFKTLFIKIPGLIITSIKDSLVYMYKSVKSMFSNLGNILVNTFKFLFIKLPVLILKSILSALSFIGTMIIKALGYSVIYLVKLITGSLRLFFVTLPSLLIKGLNWVVDEIVSLFTSMMKFIVFSIPKAIVSAITFPFRMIGKIVDFIVDKIGDFIRFVIYSIPKGIVLLVKKIFSFFTKKDHKKESKSFIESIFHDSSIFKFIGFVINFTINAFKTLFKNIFKTIFVNLPKLLGKLALLPFKLITLIVKSILGFILNIPRLLIIAIMKGLKHLIIDLPRKIITAVVYAFRDLLKDVFGVKLSDKIVQKIISVAMWPFKMIFKLISGLVLPIFKLIDKLFKLVMKMKTIFQPVIAVAGFVFKIIGGIIRFIVKIILKLVDAIESFFEKIKTLFEKLGNILKLGMSIITAPFRWAKAGAKKAWHAVTTPFRWAKNLFSGSKKDESAKAKVESKKQQKPEVSKENASLKDKLINAYEKMLDKREALKEKKYESIYKRTHSQFATSMYMEKDAAKKLVESGKFKSMGEAFRKIHEISSLKYFLPDTETFKKYKKISKTWKRQYALINDYLSGKLTDKDIMEAKKYKQNAIGVLRKANLEAQKSMIEAEVSYSTTPTRTPRYFKEKIEKPKPTKEEKKPVPQTNMNTVINTSHVSQVSQTNTGVSRTSLESDIDYTDFVTGI